MPKHAQKFQVSVQKKKLQLIKKVPWFVSLALTDSTPQEDALVSVQMNNSDTPQKPEQKNVLILAVITDNTKKENYVLKNAQKDMEQTET